MPFVSRRADLLEASLKGDPSTDQEVRDLVVTARRIPSLTSPVLAPRDEFVSALGLRLRAEALTLPAREARSLSGESEGHLESEVQATGARRRGARPVVLVIGRGLPRALAGATVSLLLVGAIVGGASRSALPGGLLYPVKHLLDSAAVQLAGSDFDRGATLLSQAQEHISDAGALVERDGGQADPAAVNEALLGAYDAVSGGQRALLGDFHNTGDLQSLIAVQDFAVRALPQLNALRPLVPVASRPGVDSLIALLQQTRTTLAHTIAACGRPCATLGVAGQPGSPPSPSGLPSMTTPGNPFQPGLPIRGGLVVPDPIGAVTGPGGLVVSPAVPPPPITARATVTPSVAIPPRVTVGPLPVSPSPVKIPTPALPPASLPGLP